MTSDNWVDIMMRDMLSLEEKHGLFGQVLAAIFYTIFFFFAQYIVVNLFIAVILESFDLDATTRSANRALGIDMAYDMSTVRVKQVVQKALFSRTKVHAEVVNTDEVTGRPP